MNTEQRVLLHVATSKDATLTGTVLARAQVHSQVCTGLQQLIDELATGAGALMIAEETLNDQARESLAQVLRQQPPWSDVPVILLARQGAGSRAIHQMLERIPNVTVIERPMRVASMLSTVRSALRARRRQYEVRNLLQGLREANRRKTEFLATLAHELRNPLAPLSTALTLLSRSNPQPEVAQHHELMRRQVDHMVRLINDLMEVSRFTRGKIELQLRPLSLQDAIEGAIEQSRPLLEAAGHTLKVSLPVDPIRLLGDRVRLNQVFSNLLNNAAKYTPPGGHVSLHAHRADDHVLVTVADTGAGLAPEMLESIFEMFVQVSDNAKAAQGGLGIGLTLLKTLVELHGGSVVAGSPGLGRGSTFTVRLPLDHGDEAPAPAVPTAHDVHPTLAGRTVLVVDDNRDAAESLAELLRCEGATVLPAHSGAEALQVATGQIPDAAVLDIGMPGMDGCELARQLRARLPRDRAPLLIALTGWGQRDDKRHIAEAGFDHHLLKPVDAEVLIALIANASPAVTRP